MIFFQNRNIIGNRKKQAPEVFFEKKVYRSLFFKKVAEHLRWLLLNRNRNIIGQHSCYFPEIFKNSWYRTPPVSPSVLSRTRYFSYILLNCFSGNGNILIICLHYDVIWYDLFVIDFKLSEHLVEFQTSSLRKITSCLYKFNVPFNDCLLLLIKLLFISQ